MLRMITRSSILRSNVCARGCFSHLQCQEFATASGSRVVEVTTDEDYKQEIKKAADANQVAILDFTAIWCGPCKVMSPLFESLSEKHTEARFLKLDIDSQELANTVGAHQISAVPTFKFIKDNQEVDSFTGADPKKLKELVAKWAE